MSLLSLGLARRSLPCLFQRLVVIIMAVVPTIAGVLIGPASVRAQSVVGPSLVVIMAEGLNSSSDEQGAVFSQVWPAVVQYAPDAMRIDYSYRGGTFDDLGNWLPRPYTACDTQQSMFNAAAELGSVITLVRTAWPSARLAIIGHSLGGFVEAVWFAAVATRTPDPTELPDVAMTIDSPLRGISPQHAAVGWTAGRQQNCPVLQALPELVDVYQGGSAADSLQHGIATAIQNGTRVVMVGNRSDIAYSCCGANQTVAPAIEDSQLLQVDGAEDWEYASITPDLPGLDPNQPTSHHAALFNQAIVDRIAAALAGADTETQSGS